MLVDRYRVGMKVVFETTISSIPEKRQPCCNKRPDPPDLRWRAAPLLCGSIDSARNQTLERGMGSRKIGYRNQFSNQVVEIVQETPSPMGGQRGMPGSRGGPVLEDNRAVQSAQSLASETKRIE